MKTRAVTGKNGKIYIINLSDFKPETIKGIDVLVAYYEYGRSGETVIYSLDGVDFAHYQPLPKAEEKEILEELDSVEDLGECENFQQVFESENYIFTIQSYIGSALTTTVIKK